MRRLLRRILPLVLGVVTGTAFALTPAVAVVGPINWPQWGQNPQHQGFVNVVGQNLEGTFADITFDPNVPTEQAFSGGDLLVHYQAPLVHEQDVFMESKSLPAGAVFDGSDFAVQNWHQNRFHWEGGELVKKWTFDTDWKALPVDFVGGWENVYHAVLANGFVYDPGFAGTIFKLNLGAGSVVTRINPFGTMDPNTFVASPLSADDMGNVYYNALRIDPVNLTTLDSWLVKVARDDSVSKVSYADLLAAANPPTTCFKAFGNSTLPWPPSPTAVPSSGPCGPQRPGVNVTPAIAPDGTIYTVSRADSNSRYGFVVAVKPDLTLKWAASLRDSLNDGCGVLVPIASSTTPEKGKCRFGANVGVDPGTNQRPAGRVIDQSSSSPTVTSDGGVLYGAYTRYNAARGHLFKFSPTGQFLAAYDFGWDSTPAVFSHDGTWSTVIKDNHYDEELGFYCNPSSVPISQVVCAFTGVPAGPFFITQLNASLVPEWKFHSTETNSCVRQPNGSLSCVSDHPNGFEWCINAPAIDTNGTVFVNSEDGHAYRIPQGHTGVFDAQSPGPATQRLFLNLAIGAAYTPLSIGPDGLIYTEDGGNLFAVGTGGRGIKSTGGHRATGPRGTRKVTQEDFVAANE